MSGLFLWILMIGGIAELDKPERTWFVSQLALLIGKLKMGWNAAECILGNCLWLDSLCGASGRDLWAEIGHLKI
jgi:hypothetical protein